MRSIGAIQSLATGHAYTTSNTHLTEIMKHLLDHEFRSTVRVRDPWRNESVSILDVSSFEVLQCGFWSYLGDQILK